MAIVLRYFGVTAAGTGDGLTWANRAALFTGGVWSALITGFAFNATDGMEARVGPGIHSLNQTLAAGIFAANPTAVNPLFIHGCDSSGNRLVPPNLGWTSDMPNWSDASLPEITTTNQGHSSQTNVTWRMLKCTATARNSTMFSGGTQLDWCHFVNSTNNATAGGTGTIPRVTNCVYIMSGGAYDTGHALFTIGDFIANCRIIGSSGGATGARCGIRAPAVSPLFIFRCTIIGHGLDGIVGTALTSPQWLDIRNCTIANNGGNGIKHIALANQANQNHISGNMITGNAGWGIETQSAARVLALQNRLRNNTLGNINVLGNYPADLDNYIAAGTDAAEYVDAVTTKDFRLKAGSPIVDMGFGVSQQAAAATSGGSFAWG